MSQKLHCWKCHAALPRIDLPVGRFERCPSCLCDLRVCRACVHYDTTVMGQCRHERAERLVDKELANFCQYHRYRGGRFDNPDLAPAAQAKSALDALFGGTAAGADADSPDSLFDSNAGADDAPSLDSLFGEGATPAEADSPEDELARLFGDAPADKADANDD